METHVAVANRTEDALSWPARLSVAEAVAEYVKGGTTVYIGNFGAQLFAVGHEIVRQDCCDLHLIMGSGGILMDQLIGSGCVAEATFSHCWSPVGPAPASCFRRAMESMERSMVPHEMSLGSLTAGLTAAAWGVPFMPVPLSAGNDFGNEGGNATTSVDSPYGPADVVKAIAPDVAFIHVDGVTRRGDGLLRSPRGEAVAAAAAAGIVVLVAEELVDDEAVARSSPAAVAFPGMLTSAIVVSPGAVHPDGVAGRYDRDISWYRAYSSAARTEDGFEAWMHRWVRRSDFYREYRQRTGLPA